MLPTVALVQVLISSRFLDLEWYYRWNSETCQVIITSGFDRHLGHQIRDGTLTWSFYSRPKTKPVHDKLTITVEPEVAQIRVNNNLPTRD